jgi:hypothetical protein
MKIRRELRVACLLIFLRRIAAKIWWGKPHPSWKREKGETSEEGK